MVNSLFWDVSKYGEKPVLDKESLMYHYTEFEANLRRFIDYFERREREMLGKVRNSAKQARLPCLKIWRSTLPISTTANTKEMTGTQMNMIKLVNEISHSNYHAEQIMKTYHWDILDGQYWFRQNYVEHRADDGIHWNSKAHRWLTNIFLTHVAEEWGKGLPIYVQTKGASISSKQPYVIKKIDENGITKEVKTKFRRDQKW